MELENDGSKRKESTMAIGAFFRFHVKLWEGRWKKTPIGSLWYRVWFGHQPNIPNSKRKPEAKINLTWMRWKQWGERTNPNNNYTVISPRGKPIGKAIYRIFESI